MNKLLLLLTAATAMMAALLWWQDEALVAEPALPKPPRPVTTPRADRSFDFTCTALALHREPPRVQLPDLRGELLFYGVNQRPDASREAPILHLGLKGEDEVATLPAGERCYLRFHDGYSFATAPTNLWIEADASSEGNVRFQAAMETSDGREIAEPDDCANFSLPLTPYNRGRGGSWTIGSARVDNSLLARMRARWYGEDLFLSNHGDDGSYRGRQRVDFGEPPQNYSCFVAPGETLIWKDGQWQQTGETAGYPLLVLKRCDGRSLLFDLWDEEGKSRITLNLMRSRAGWTRGGKQDHLRFVAAKTWTQLVLESGKKRLEVAPGDWLLFDEAGFHKIEEVDEVDAYVEGELPGELMVINGLERREGKQMLVTHLYNRTRTDCREQAIALTSSSGSPAPPLVYAKPPELPEERPRRRSVQEIAAEVESTEISDVIRAVLEEQLS